MDGELQLGLTSNAIHLKSDQNPDTLAFCPDAINDSHEGNAQSTSMNERF